MPCHLPVDAGARAVGNRSTKLPPAVPYGLWLSALLAATKHSPCPTHDALPQVNDSVVFAAEVLVLRESCDIRHLPLLPGEAVAQGPPAGALPPAPAAAAAAAASQPEDASGDAAAAVAAGRPASALSDAAGSSSSGAVVVAEEKTKTVFTWRIENFQAFKVGVGGWVDRHLGWWGRPGPALSKRARLLRRNRRCCPAAHACCA